MSSLPTPSKPKRVRKTFPPSSKQAEALTIEYHEQLLMDTYGPDYLTFTK